MCSDIFCATLQIGQEVVVWELHQPGERGADLCADQRQAAQLDQGRHRPRLSLCECSLCVASPVHTVHLAVLIALIVCFHLSPFHRSQPSATVWFLRIVSGQNTSPQEAPLSSRSLSSSKYSIIYLYFL